MSVPRPAQPLIRVAGADFVEARLQRVQHAPADARGAEHHAFVEGAELLRLVRQELPLKQVSATAFQAALPWPPTSNDERRRVLLAFARAAAVDCSCPCTHPSKPEAWPHLHGYLDFMQRFAREGDMAALATTLSAFTTAVTVIRYDIPHDRKAFNLKRIAECAQLSQLLGDGLLAAAVDRQAAELARWAEQQAAAAGSEQQAAPPPAALLTSARLRHALCCRVNTLTMTVLLEPALLRQLSPRERAESASLQAQHGELLLELDPDGLLGLTTAACMLSGPSTQSMVEAAIASRRVSSLYHRAWGLAQATGSDFWTAMVAGNWLMYVAQNPVGYPEEQLEAVLAAHAAGEPAQKRSARLLPHTWVDPLKGLFGVARSQLLPSVRAQMGGGRRGGAGRIADARAKAGQATQFMKDPLTTYACSHCKQYSVALKKCSRCQVARYCSKDCQTAGWKQGHKKECQPVA